MNRPANGLGASLAKNNQLIAIDTHRLWREAPNVQRVILKNRGPLSSYMAALAPELYRDSLVKFITENNPK